MAYNIIDLVGSVAKALSTADQHDNIQQTINTARAKTAEYTTADKGLKGMFAKSHSGEWGWLISLLLIIATPFVVAYGYRQSQRMMKQETDEEIYSRVRRQKQAEFEDDDVE